MYHRVSLYTLSLDRFLQPSSGDFDIELFFEGHEPRDKVKRCQRRRSSIESSRFQQPCRIHVEIIRLRFFKHAQERSDIEYLSRICPIAGFISELYCVRVSTLLWRKAPSAREQQRWDCSEIRSLPYHHSHGQRVGPFHVRWPRWDARYYCGCRVIYLR